jgi:hypothetical protein
MLVAAACIREGDELALRHLMYVNRWSGRRATRHVEEAFKQFEERSQHHWSLDLGLLLNAGIQVREPPEPDDRDMIAFALETSIEQSRDVWRPERASAVAVASYGAHPDRMPDNAFPKHFVKAQGTRRGRTPAEQ